MKTNLIIKFAALLMLSVALFSCGKEESDGVGSNGSIYGCVTDFATGEPVKNANVQLQPYGETTLTGSDGTYEFLDVAEGNYSITVSKAGYDILIDNYVIKVTNGRKAKRDVQITKQSSPLHILNEEGTSTNIVDFGEAFVTKKIKLYNSGEITLDWNLTYQSAWIASVTPTSGTLGFNRSTEVVIVIDRSMLSPGNNASVINIDYYNGSIQISVNAKLEPDYHVLHEAGIMVQKHDIGKADWETANSMCNNSVIFGFNDWRLPTKSEMAIIYQNRNEIGNFVQENEDYTQETCYWTSTKDEYNIEYCYIEFDNEFENGGSFYYTNNSYRQYNIRAVRTIN